MNNDDQRWREIKELEKLMLGQLEEMQQIQKELIEGPMSKETKAKSRTLLQEAKVLRQRMNELTKQMQTK
jgi:hypothetical protein